MKVFAEQQTSEWIFWFVRQLVHMQSGVPLLVDFQLIPPKGEQWSITNVP